jgi:predicted RNase H-like nuclease (RuvC/YqgF family)
MTCDGYIEVTLDAVEEIGYDEIKKVVVPSGGCEEFAEKMFNYAMESFSRQERERRGRIISAKERISELESALEEAKKESNHWKQKYEKMRNRCADLYNRDKW